MQRPGSVFGLRSRQKGVARSEIVVAPGPTALHNKGLLFVPFIPLGEARSLLGGVLDMTRWLLALTFLLGGLVTLSRADYIIIVANLGLVKEQEEARQQDQQQQRPGQVGNPQGGMGRPGQNLQGPRGGGGGLPGRGGQRQQGGGRPGAQQPGGGARPGGGMPGG